MAVAIFAALLLGVGGVLLLATLDPRMTSEDELLRHVPVLARIPRAHTRVVRSYLRGRRGRFRPTCGRDIGLCAPAWRRAGWAGESPRAVLVTSAIKAEGKTMTSVNLAKALAAGGLRVVLVDADFRRPAVGAVFGQGESGGLAELLFGRTSVDEALVDAPGYGDWLRLLLPGMHDRSTCWSRADRRIIDQLKGEADVVVVDFPPLTEFADAFALVDAVDIVLIAVRLGHSRRDRFAELNRFLSQHPVPPAGLVVTSQHRSRDVGLTPSIESLEALLGEVSRTGSAAKADG